MLCKWEKLWRQITTRARALLGPEKIYVSDLSFKAGCSDCHCYWYPRFLSNFSLDSCQINHNTVRRNWLLRILESGHRLIQMLEFLKSSLVPLKIWCGVARRLILGDWWHPVSKAQKTDVRGHTGPEETNLWKNVRAELIPEITAWASVTKAAGKECWRTPQLSGRCKPWVTHHLLLTININKVFKSDKMGIIPSIQRRNFMKLHNFKE